ncbi:MAG TPA: DUF4129 domain-containing protein [Ramlibacter sp.]|jgi:hypothetical protein
MRLAELVLAAVIAWGAIAPAAAAPPSREEVQQAAQAARRHPDLGGLKAQRTLRWRQQDEPRKPVPSEPGAWAWLAGLVGWLAEAGRWLVWLAGAAIVAVLAVRIWRWIQVRGPAGPRRTASLPSHVQSLDIRPESLPAAIGAAAARLWQDGQQLAALSLLYRGGLSRLVHTHGVPIRAASTEGECLALAQGALDAPAGALFAQLVGTWQHAVYGARLPDGQQVLGLCREFDLRLAADAGVTR